MNIHRSADSQFLQQHFIQRESKMEQQITSLSISVG